MLKADNQNTASDQINVIPAKKVLDKESAKLAIDIHAMPKTSEKSLKIWFVLGGGILLVVIILFLIFI